MSNSTPERPAWQPRKHDDQRIINPFEKTTDPDRLEEEHRETEQLDEVDELEDPQDPPDPSEASEP